jgi:hypothetical protein
MARLFLILGMYLMALILTCLFLTAYRTRVIISSDYVQLVLNRDEFSLFNNVLPVVAMAVLFEKNKLPIRVLSAGVEWLRKCSNAGDE